MPQAAGPAMQTASRLIPEQPLPSGLDRIICFDTSSMVYFRHLSIRYLTGQRRPFPSALTTTSFGRSLRGRFGNSFCQPYPRGYNPHQLHCCDRITPGRPRGIRWSIYLETIRWATSPGRGARKWAVSMSPLCLNLGRTIRRRISFMGTTSISSATRP